MALRRVRSQPPTPPAVAVSTLDAPADAALEPAPPLDGHGPAKRRVSLSDTFASFRIRDFRFLTLSTLAAGFAQWAKQLALFALVYEMTGSAVQLGTVAAFRGGVGTIIAPFGGYLSDRFPRRTVIVWSTLLDGALAGILAALVIADVAQVWHVYAIAFGGGLAQSINQPARQAYVYDVTTDETLPNAIAVNSMVQNVSRVAGPSLFGVMMAAWGVVSGLLMLVVLQVAAALITLSMSRTTRQARTASSGAPMRMMVEGLRYCWTDRRILGLVVIGVIPSLLVYPYIPFLKIVSEEVLHKGNAGFGVLSSMMGWGSILGLLALASAGNAKHQGRLMIGGYLVYAVLLTGFAASSHYYLSMAILATAGIFHSVATALNLVLLQRFAPNEMRGRVMAANQMAHGVQPIGSFPMAFAISAWGAQWGIGVFMAAATVCFIVFAITWTNVRRI